ncbi:MAG: FliM/FliN family flagellar motor switch protein [Phycisphaerales bacterium]|nr:FliM/FliN family flagellar motor switch protein [Phycisphaerales bacterium]
MFTQEEMDAVLRDAQQAVDTLSDDVNQLVEPQPEPPAPPAPVPSMPADSSSVAASDPSPSSAASHSADRVHKILDLRVPLFVRLAERPMPICDIMQFGPGTILEFDRTVDSELDLMINNCQIGSGVAVKVGEHFGLRIARIGNVKERIDSLGGG